MKKFTKLFAVMMLSLMVAFAAGCKPEENPNNGGENNGGNNGGGDDTPTMPISPTEEGMYLGIIGFNENLYQKEIGLLNSTTKQDYVSFINNLRQEDLTALYYADYTGLKKLQKYSEPPTLTEVALVTFTDGLDNLSTSNDVMNPEGYGTVAEYRAGLYNMIMGEQVYGHYVSAYTIGLKGQDVQNNLGEFITNINMLASSPTNVYEVEDMNLALQGFVDIANKLYTQNTTVNLKLRLPGGIDDGTTIRFTFDQVSDGGLSGNYIQATYRRTANNGRCLENIIYQGFQQGESSMVPVSQSETGTYHWFEFEHLTLFNNNPISQNDINLIQLWKQQGSLWQKDSEYPVDSSTEVTEKKSSAMIMLVLDCTSSLGNDFGAMKDAAIRFVETLVSSSGGNNGGGNNGGSNYDPVGILNGEFSVSSHQKVYFSKGNLQYQASTNKWRFAEHQYDFVANDNGSIGHNNNGWIDLFGWGTSNFAHGSICYQPWSTSQTYNDYFVYGCNNCSLYDQTGLADWGVNAISNGGNQTRVWRTLTKEEWKYLLMDRTTLSGTRFAKARVAGKNGLIILPDDWSSTSHSLQNINVENASYSDNDISSVAWNTLQDSGAVFLPAAGSRAGTFISGININGYYWSSSCNNDYYASLVSFSNSSINPDQNDYKYYGQSVRLVCESE